MNKTLTTSLTAIGLAGAGIIGAGALVNAQDPGDDPSLVDAGTEDGEEGERRGRRGHRGAKPEVVAEALGITTDQLAEYRQQGMSIADIATEVGVSVDTVSAAMLAELESHLAEHVEAGDITQEEADEKLANATEKIDERIDAEPGEHRRGRRGFRGNVEAVTETLGVTADELRDYREQGLSLAEVAEQQGVSTDDLVGAIVDDIEEHLADKVTEGDITQEEADEKLAGVTEKVTERVNAEPSEDGPRGPRGRRGPGGERGPGGPAGDEAPADA